MGTCEAHKCTRQAVYHVTVKTTVGQEKPDFERDYCPIHTRGLGDEMVRKLGNYHYHQLHEYLEVEHVNA